MAFLVPLCYLTALDNLGAIVPGARGYIYQAGTTTALQTYSDYLLSNANPIPYLTADSAGRFENTPAYVADGTLLRFVITSADGGTTHLNADQVLAPYQLSSTSIFQSYSTQSANFAITDAMNNQVIGVDCSSGDVSVSADSNASVIRHNGFWFTLIKTNSGGGSIFVAGTGAQTINGQASYEIDTPFEATTFVSIGTNGWYITAATSREEMGEIDIVEYTAAAVTLQLSDKGKLLKLNNAGATALTVPPNSGVGGVPFVIGTRLEGMQYNTGEVTITPGAGVTVRSAGGFLKTLTQYSIFALTKLAANEWHAAGDLEL